MNYLKFKTNLPEMVTFKFNQGIEKDNPFKQGEKQYQYGVTYQGEDYMLTATPILNDKLQKVGNLQGKTLQILKYEDGQKKFWKILDAQGQEIELGQSNYSKPKQITNQPQKPATGQNLASSDVLKINENIKRLAKKIQDMDKDINSIKTWIAGMPDGEKGLELHRALEDSPKIKELNEEIPIIGIEDEVKVEDIPF